jgi:hypothetical protein
MLIGKGGLREVDWLFAINALHQDGQFAIQHEPADTPRYEMARTQYPYVLRCSKLLGIRPAVGHEDYAIELATWCPSPTGLRCGFYCVIRVVLDGGNPRWATLFCFWDGTYGSPCFREFSSAKAFALTKGYQEVNISNE